jgi:hypothetical protein
MTLKVALGKELASLQIHFGSRAPREKSGTAEPLDERALEDNFISGV